ncbi:hypothetical protein QUA23_26190 [Microcoleus sp. Pol1C5]
MSPNQPDGKRNLSQGAKSCITHLWPISRRHSEKKSPIEQEFSLYTSRKPNFLPVNLGRVHRCDSSFKQLRYVHPTLFAALKIGPGAIGCQSLRELRREV